MSYDKVMHGKRLYHSRLLSQGRIEEAAAYANKSNLLLDQPVTGDLAPTEPSEVTPGGEGVQGGGAAQNWDSSIDPSKNLPKDLTFTTTATLDKAGEPILATVERAEGMGDTEVAGEGQEAPRENIGGVAREGCPEGVWWAMVTGDQVNRLRKNIRLHPSGEEGVLHVGYRLCQRLGERLKFEWFPVTRSREPGQEKDWVVWMGKMIP